MDGDHVVPVDLEGAPPERHELLGDVAQAHDLGARPVDLQAVVVHDRDQVVGFSATTTGYLHAILWDREVGTIDLGTFPGGYNSAALDINNAGQVVGWSTAAIGTRAFLWDAVHGMRTIPPMEVGEGDLYSWIDTDVYFMTDAFLINNLGQVEGYCSDGNVCIWDPIDGFTSIPPPRHNYRKNIPRGFNDAPRSIVSRKRVINLKHDLNYTTAFKFDRIEDHKTTVRLDN